MKFTKIQIIAFIIIFIGFILIIGLFISIFLYNEYTGLYPRTSYPDILAPEGEYSYSSPNILLPIQLMISFKINSSTTPNCSVSLTELNSGKTAVILRFNNGNGTIYNSCVDCLSHYGFGRTGHFNISIRNNGIDSIKIISISILILKYEGDYPLLSEICNYFPIIIATAGLMLYSLSVYIEKKDKNQLNESYSEILHV